MDDRKIIALLWQRAESALEALAEKFGKGLLALARNILPDLRDAEEAVSDTYLAVWHAVPPAKPDPLPPYIYKVGKYTALNRPEAQRLRGISGGIVRESFRAGPGIPGGGPGPGPGH